MVLLFPVFLLAVSASFSSGAYFFIQKTSSLGLFCLSSSFPFFCFIEQFPHLPVVRKGPEEDFLSGPVLDLVVSFFVSYALLSVLISPLPFHFLPFH